MYKEKQRKLTSVTLMAIMVAGGMTFAIPGIAPVAYAQTSPPNLTVSAANSNFDNYMVGPQVIEVVVNDSDINNTDDANGEPDVTVNGKILRMAQAVDGQWYGYFADRTQAENADRTTTVPKSGLDFGTICTIENDGDFGQLSANITGVNMDDAVGFALGTVDNCNKTSALPSSTTTNNVLREAKALNGNNAANTSADTNGQIGVLENAWPFIQLYDLNPTGNVNIQYNKGGGAQSTVLTFDTVESFALLELDRQTYPLGAQIHATITDTWLNIDPTDEDSWTFDTTTGNPYYQVFDENGRSGGTAINIGDSLGDLMCDDNCKLLVNTNDQNRPNPVITIQTNDDSKIRGGDANNATSFFILNDAENPRAENELRAGSVPVTITENGPNTGVFSTYDESDTSVLAITTSAQRGTSGSIDYNESPRSVLAGFDFATIDIQPGDDEWNSGESIPFILTDEDQNKNSHVDEDLVLSDPSVTLIPALSTGDPFTIGEADDKLRAAYYTGTDLQAPAKVTVDDFSQIARVTADGTGAADLLVIDLETTAAELRDTISNATDFRGFNLLNYDIRSLEQSGVTVLLVQNNGTIINANSTLADTTQFLPLHDADADQDLVLLNPQTSPSAWSTTPLPHTGTAPPIDGPEVTDPPETQTPEYVDITSGPPLNAVIPRFNSAFTLDEGVRITEITVKLGTNAGFDGNNDHDVYLPHLFGDGTTVSFTPSDATTGQTRTITNPVLSDKAGASFVSSGDNELVVRAESDGTFDIAYTLADESTHTIKVIVEGGLANDADASATVTGAQRLSTSSPPTLPNPPTISAITVPSTSSSTATHVLTVTNIPSGYSFTSAASANLSNNVSATGADVNGTVTITFELPTVSTSTTITGNLNVLYGNGTNTLTTVVPVTITVVPSTVTPPTIQNIAVTGTGGTSETHNLSVSNAPSGYSFVSAAPDSTLRTASVTASGAESGGTVTVTFGLPTVSSSTTITGNLDVRYSNGSNNLDVAVPVTLTVNPVPFTPITSGFPLDVLVDRLLELEDGVRITEITVQLGTDDNSFNTSSNDDYFLSLFRIFGELIDATDTNSPVSLSGNAGNSRIINATDNLRVLSGDDEFEITATLADGTEHTITILVSVPLAQDVASTAKVTGAERGPAGSGTPTVITQGHPVGEEVTGTLQRNLETGVRITKVLVNIGTSDDPNVNTPEVENDNKRVVLTQVYPVSQSNTVDTITTNSTEGDGFSVEVDNTGNKSVTIHYDPDSTATNTSVIITTTFTNTSQEYELELIVRTGLHDLLDSSAEVAEAINTSLIRQIMANIDMTQPTIHQIIADLIPFMTPAYAQETTVLTLGDTLYDTAHLPDDANIGIAFLYTSNAVPQGTTPIAVDFFSFGFTDDGVQASERTANQIIRIEAEETADNSSTFAGSLEYVMVNQINIMDPETYTGISPIADDPSFIVIEDLTDEDAPRVTYADLGADGVITPVSDQQEAPSHSGVVTLNQDSYKVADTVEVKLVDADLNVDPDKLEIYTVVSNVGDVDNDQVGANVHGELEDLSFGSIGRLLDITFDDLRWETTATCTLSGDNGLGATGFTLRETGPGTGIFTGDFQIPANWCRSDNGAVETTTGLDIEVNYVDFRDASGEIIEVGDSAGVRANTGSVSLDRTVYPVPFGVPTDFDGNTDDNPDGRSVFPIHAAGIDNDVSRGLDAGEFLTSGDLTVHIRVNDPDFDVNPSGEDEIAQNVAGEDYGPVKISVQRGASTVILGYAGGADSNDGKIGVGDNDSADLRQFGPISEIAPDAGIYELDMTLRFTDGPADSQCPNDVMYTALDGTNLKDVENRFSGDTSGEDFCILQGDILQVEYTDPTDASGDQNTVTDSATFDLRNGVLQADKSVYIIGSDMILTLIEPDLDLDNDAAETYDLDLIEWDSDAGTVSMGNAGGEAAAFDPEPTDLRETGDSTGVFQIVIEIPQELDNDKLERGEEIVLEYTDWGPSGSDYVGDEDEDINWTLFTSNFGATVELDQKVYTWTDKVYITIVAPDHNFDGDLVDEIGDSDEDPIKVSTRGFDLDGYKLVETGTDTGIFTGEVILTGFTHDADGDTTTGTNGNDVISTEEEGSGPTDGKLPADDDDGITVSFEFSENETVVGSALIRWNIGEVQWLEASYPATGTGIVRVIDPDMNLDPEAVDNFSVDAWSDSDAGGVDLTVTETNEATGIFEGTVFFTVTDESTGHRLRVAEGDTVTAEYEDNTLPDPHTTADELDITATSLIGTIVPPLERAPASNLRTVDAFGNTLDSVMVDQQVQITADLANGQDREQAFAYLVQIQNSDGVTASLAWITGSLSAGQSFSPALSWTPDNSGEYTVTAFVWESVDNPTALSPPITTTVQVN